MQIAAHYPPGFRARRGLNWGALGLMYASHYMCRYNFRFAGPGMNEAFGFKTSDLAMLWVVRSLAYGTGQLVNGLFTDRISGKWSIDIGGKKRLAAAIPS
jgi:OPA family glycerol-3-phosphate transporter-like MFS transporter